VVSLIEGLSPSAFIEPQSTWVYGIVYDLWILRPKIKYEIQF
jgi:hypothetical protein